jgi:hypothetical protein
MNEHKLFSIVGSCLAVGAVALALIAAPIFG